MSEPYHGVWVVNIDIVILAADRLLHKWFVDLKSVHDDIVFRLLKPLRIGSGGLLLGCSSNYDVLWNTDAIILCR